MLAILGAIPVIGKLLAWIWSLFVKPKPVDPTTEELAASNATAQTELAEERVADATRQQTQSAVAY